MNMNLIVPKLVSGRFWLTIAAGVVLVWGTISGALQTETVSAILVMIIRDYFTRNREGEPLK